LVLPFRLWPDVGDPAQVRYLAVWTPPENIAVTFRNLELVFSVGAGVDQFDFSQLPTHVPLIRMLEPGIAESMVEYVTMAVLALHRDLVQFMAGGTYFIDLIMTNIRMPGRIQFLKSLGYNPKRDNGTSKPVPLLFQLIYQHYQTRLDNKNLIDNFPLSEEKGIKPYDEALNKNYINWLLENSADVNKLEQQNFGAGVTRPNSLLYMMLHNAFLLEARHSIWRLFAFHNILADELVRSRKFMNISSQPDVSAWEVFRAPANRLIPAETSDRSLLSFVQLDRFNAGAGIDIGRYLNQAKDALQTLKGLPTARLERLLAEHIDTLSYRLDSWQTALFDRRLRQQRELTSVSPQRRTGIYIGS